MLNRFADIFYQAGDFLEKLPTGYTLAIIWGFLQPFFMFDYDFLGWVTFLFMADTVIGLYKHLRAGTASSHGFTKFFDKLIVIFGTVVVIHVVKGYEGGSSYFGEFFATGGHFTLIAWMAKGILRNLSDITGGTFPPKSWLNRLDNILKK